MVTKTEQMAPIVKPSTAVLIAVVFVFIGLIAFFMASGPKTASTATYTQDSGNQPGSLNNSMNSGGTGKEMTGSPAQNSVLPNQ